MYGFAALPRGERASSIITPGQSNQEERNEKSDDAEAGEEMPGENDTDEVEEVEFFLYIKSKEVDITLISPYRGMEQIGKALQREPKLVKVNSCLRVTCMNRAEQRKIKQI